MSAAQVRGLVFGSVVLVQRARLALGLLAAALCGLACGSPEPAALPAVAALPSTVPATPALFSVYGLPGPWSREGATRGAFERDSRVCRDRSSEARHSGADDPHEAAYRAFLDCMTEHAWTRGLVPKQVRLSESPERDDSSR